MSKTITQAVAFALAALMTLATVAGMDSLAATQYEKADTLAMAPDGQTQVAMQHVTVVGRRATA